MTVLSASFAFCIRPSEVVLYFRFERRKNSLLLPQLKEETTTAIHIDHIYCKWQALSRSVIVGKGEYIFARFFSFDRAQNTMVVYSVLRN